jgi:Holliday junction resolvase
MAKINVKRKGSKGENSFAAWLRSHGYMAGRDSGSGNGNTIKGDIHNNLDMSIEVKTCKALSLQEAWKQTTYAASVARNMPVVAIHFDKMPKDTWLIVMHSDDWIEMVKGETHEQDYEDPKKKYAFQRARDALQTAIKYL